MGLVPITRPPEDEIFGYELKPPERLYLMIFMILHKLLGNEKAKEMLAKFSSTFHIIIILSIIEG